jgi:hypothetical protein
MDSIKFSSSGFEDFHITIKLTLRMERSDSRLMVERGVII